MKKIFVTALAALLMTAAFTGCGSKEENSTPGTNDSKIVEEQKEIELVPTQEILNADMDSFKVQLGNDFIVELPITLQELMDMGATIPADVNPVNEIINAGGCKCIDVTINDIVFENVFFINFENNELQLKDCSVNSLNSGSFIGSYCPFVLPKGIKVGSTVEELKAAYGEAAESHLDYCDYSFYSGDKTIRIGLQIHFDIEKQIITDISYYISDESEEIE